MNRTRQKMSAVAAAVAVSGCASAAAAQQSLTGSVGNDWCSTSQAAQGKALFAQKCAVCHGAKLQGGAPRSPEILRSSPGK
ncbi:MAG: cytochrome c [Candidatus Cybelea sp.]